MINNIMLYFASLFSKVKCAYEISFYMVEIFRVGKSDPFSLQWWNLLHRY